LSIGAPKAHNDFHAINGRVHVYSFRELYTFQRLWKVSCLWTYNMFKKLCNDNYACL